MLAAQVGVGSQADTDLARTNDRLAGALTEARDRLSRLERFAARAAAGRRTYRSPTSRSGSPRPLPACTAAGDHHPARRRRRLPGNLDDLKQRATAIADRFRAEDVVDAEQDGWRAELGARFAAERTDWEDCAAAADWLAQVDRRTRDAESAWADEPDIVPAASAERLLRRTSEWSAVDSLADAGRRYEEATPEFGEPLRRRPPRRAL